MLRLPPFSRSIGLLLLSLGACRTDLNSLRNDDPRRPYHEGQVSFALRDFDRLLVGEAIAVNARAGADFRVLAVGDTTDLRELRVERTGTTLRAGYVRSRPQRHPLRLEVTLPLLAEARFEGAVAGKASGFDQSGPLRVTLGGASSLELQGRSPRLDAEVTGASTLSAFDFPSTEARLSVSGASLARVTVGTRLEAVASGASTVQYLGDPVTQLSASGASVIQKK